MCEKLGGPTSRRVFVAGTREDRLRKYRIHLSVCHTSAIGVGVGRVQMDDELDDEKESLSDYN